MAHRTLLALCLTLASFAASADINGKVVGVLDGDTIDVLVDKKPVRVRLAQIDAPEKRQAFGTRARQALSDAAFNQQVRVVESGRDRYGRVIGTVYTGGKDVNRTMVASGMAWAYRAYLTDKSLLKLESDARAKQVGLWADPHAIPPWEFRKQKRAAATAP